MDDTLPPRLMEPVPDGPNRGLKAFLDENDMKEAVREYYRLRGWREDTSVPSPETLKALGLEWLMGDAEVADSLVRRRLGLQPR